MANVIPKVIACANDLDAALVATPKSVAINKGQHQAPSNAGNEMRTDNKATKMDFFSLLSSSPVVPSSMTLTVTPPWICFAPTGETGLDQTPPAQSSSSTGGRGVYPPLFIIIKIINSNYSLKPFLFKLSNFSRVLSLSAGCKSSLMYNRRQKSFPYSLDKPKHWSWLYVGLHYEEKSFQY